jgi:hypothetical protein
VISTIHLYVRLKKRYGADLENVPCENQLNELKLWRPAFAPAAEYDLPSATRLFQGIVGSRTSSAIWVDCRTPA